MQRRDKSEQGVVLACRSSGADSGLMSGIDRGVNAAVRGRKEHVAMHYHSPFLRFQTSLFHTSHCLHFLTLSPIDTLPCSPSPALPLPPLPLAYLFSKDVAGVPCPELLLAHVVGHVLWGNGARVGSAQAVQATLHQLQGHNQLLKAHQKARWHQVRLTTQLPGKELANDGVMTALCSLIILSQHRRKLMIMTSNFHTSNTFSTPPHTHTPGPTLRKAVLTCGRSAKICAIISGVRLKLSLLLPTAAMRVSCSACACRSSGSGSSDGSIRSSSGRGKGVGG